MQPARGERCAPFHDMVNMVYFDKSPEEHYTTRRVAASPSIKANPAQAGDAKLQIRCQALREEPGTAMAGLPKGRAYPFLAAAREGYFFESVRPVLVTWKRSAL